MKRPLDDISIPALMIVAVVISLAISPNQVREVTPEPRQTVARSCHSEAARFGDERRPGTEECER